MKTQLNPKVYLKAAEIQGRPNYHFGMCGAIDRVCLNPVKYRSLLEEYFKENTTAYWYSLGDNILFYDPELHPRTEKGKLGRQLALLFMYEIVKDEIKRDKVLKRFLKEGNKRLKNKETK